MIFSILYLWLMSHLLHCAPSCPPQRSATPTTCTVPPRPRRASAHPSCGVGTDDSSDGFLFVEPISPSPHDLSDSLLLPRCDERGGAARSVGPWGRPRHCARGEAARGPLSDPLPAASTPPSRVSSQDGHAGSVLDGLLDGQLLVVARKLVVLRQKQPAGRRRDRAGGCISSKNDGKLQSVESTIEGTGLARTCSGTRGARASARRGNSSSRPWPRPPCPRNAGTGTVALPE